MYELLDLLRNSKVVADLDILTFVDEGDIQVLHVKAILADGSQLFVRELETSAETKYSYHWQTKRGKLICRWDNSPHHTSVKTFPHHKHEGTEEHVSDSPEPTLAAALAEIEHRLS